MRILSASRRSDIPAFYAEWFMRRVRAGFCEVFNPFGGGVARVPMQPEECAGIVFWTRYPAPILPHVAGLAERGYRFYFHFTVTGYGKPLEARNPNPANAVEAFKRLACAIGPERVIWRYDPIVISDLTPPEYHLRRFEQLTRELAGHTRRCYFSFVDYYGKTRRNLAAIKEAHFSDPDLDGKRALVKGLDAIADAAGITLHSCCEDGLVGGRVQKGHCVALELLRPEGDLRLKARPTREQCGCVESTDIGAYDTCQFGCAYCYATNSWKAARERARRHDPGDTMLWRPAAKG